MNIEPEPLTLEQLIEQIKLRADIEDDPSDHAFVQGYQAGKKAVLNDLLKLIECGSVDAYEDLTDRELDEEYGTSFSQDSKTISLLD